MPSPVTPSSSIPESSSSTPTGLLTDYRVDPIGLDRAPLLSWQPDTDEQAFEVEIAVAVQPGGGEPRTLASRTFTLHGAPRLEYPLALTAWTRVQWRVRSTGSRTSTWSQWASFETGPLDEPDWGTSSWIGTEHAPDLATDSGTDSTTTGAAPLLTATFETPADPGPLRLHACGLGSLELWINGERVGDGLFDPPPSAYDRVVLARTFDVSPLVSPGITTITARLGRGFYAMTTPTTFGWHRAPWRDEPKLRLVLVDLADPSRPLLVTGPDWTLTRTAVLDDSLYTGHVIDLTSTFTHPPHPAPPVPPSPVPASLVPAPPGQLTAVRQPPTTRRGRVPTVAHQFTASDRQRFDLAANIAGILTLTVPGTTPTLPATPIPPLTVTLGEHLDPDGRVLAADGAIPGDLQSSHLTGLRPGEPVALDLAWAGFRHVEVVGTSDPVELTVERVSSAPERVSTFTCTDPLLTAIHDTALLTFENCLQGIPIDTPLYEKQGYTGDAQLLAESHASTFWMPTALGDWFTASLLPTQSSDGSLPGIAPTPPGNWIFDVPSPAWDAALFEIPATLLRHYADVATLRRALPAQRRYLDFLERRFPTGIIDTGLGDWNAPGHIAPPESPALLSTAYHHRFLRQFARALRIMDEPAAAAHHEARATALARRFDAEFWRGDHWSASGEGEASGEAGGEGYRETSTVLPLAFGLALPERRDLAAARLVRELEARDRHLDTGIVGTRFLLPTLVRLGRCDLAFAVARQRDYPSWGWWLANGATTLYENWELDGRSHNHAMFGSIVGWLHADVAGLSPHAPGWDAVRVDPHLPAEKGFGCASALTTLAGEVSAEWERRGATISGRVLARTGVSVVVPEGARHTERRTGRTTEHLIQLQS